LNNTPKARDYVLLNKDVPILLFHITQNDFDEPEFHEDQWLTDLRPLGYVGLEAFLARRKAPKHRKHIQELLEHYGCDDLEGFLRVTHALSLNDTFWVQEAGANIPWRAVSLYENEFDQLISQAAFDGSIRSADLSSTSPEFGTDGQYAKCWVREGRDIFLYKSGSALYELEPLSEYLASQVAEALCPHAVAYDLDMYHDTLISKCRLFTSQKVGLAKASALFHGQELTIPALLDYFSSLGSEDAFRRMCVLDAVILNPDRHYGNFGVLFDTDTMAILGMAPVFDNNRSLLPELDSQQLENPDWYIQKCHPRLGRDFIINAKGLLTPEIRQDLKNWAGTAFQPHPTIPLPTERLDALSRIVNGQIAKILE
jgi:hypothetical protein